MIVPLPPFATCWLRVATKPVSPCPTDCCANVVHAATPATTTINPVLVWVCCNRALGRLSLQSCRYTSNHPLKLQQWKAIAPAFSFGSIENKLTGSAADWARAGFLGVVFLNEMLLESWVRFTASLLPQYQHSLQRLLVHVWVQSITVSGVLSSPHVSEIPGLQPV